MVSAPSPTRRCKASSLFFSSCFVLLAGKKTTVCILNGSGSRRIRVFSVFSVWVEDHVWRGSLHHSVWRPSLFSGAPYQKLPYVRPFNHHKSNSYWSNKPSYLIDSYILYSGGLYFELHNKLLIDLPPRHLRSGCCRNPAMWDPRKCALEL